MAPYSKKCTESLKVVCSMLGIQVHFRDHNTMHILLVASKDRYTTTQMSGVIYQFKCTKAGFEKEYTGELRRTLGDRLREHLIAPPPFTKPASLLGISSMWTAFSTVTWGSTSWPTSGMRSYRTPLPSISGNPSLQPNNVPTSPMAHIWDTHILHIGKYGPSPGGASFPPGTSVLQTLIGPICGKYVLVSIIFSHRHDEVMSVRIWQKPFW